MSALEVPVSLARNAIGRVSFGKTWYTDMFLIVLSREGTMVTCGCTMDDKYGYFVTFDWGTTPKPGALILPKP